jgi:DNA-binding NarL/FixJ family response regulator
MSTCTGSLASSVVIERIRTLILDDHPMFRAALEMTLERQPEFEVVASVGTVAEAIACLSRQMFDVAIVDLVLPDGRGSVFVDTVLNAQPDCKVLALSGVEEPIQVAAMLRSGASGFALKSQPVAEIIEALRAVIGGRRIIPADMHAQIDRLLGSPHAWRIERLTPREREVFELLVAGHTNQSIAAKLSLSRRTVETHRFRVMSKLAARSLGDLLQLAVRHGLVGDGERHPQ